MTQKKKISVITLHYIKNYGSVLQTYATQKKFELMGYETETVDYIRPNAEEKALLKDGLKSKNFGKNFVKKFAYVCLKKVENIRRNKIFKKFLKKYIHLSKHYHNYEELKNDPPQADIYCTGSDQTWNSEYNGGVLPAYYLDFAPEGKKRIGYSVSIGMSSIPEDEKKATQDYINKYEAISVRELSAKKLIHELGYTNVQHILDPTLVLNKSEWEPMVAPRQIKEKYIIIYRLNEDPLMEEYAKRLSEKTGCKIVRMSYYLTNFKNKGKMKFCPTVEEFLSLIYYADYVLTDSFHCTAFSLNFNKNLYAFYPGKYSTRLQSILQLTGTEHRVIKTIDDDPKDIDFEHVNEVLNSERKRVDEFIKANG